MCFSAPHSQLQEVVGVAVLQSSKVGLTQLRAWGASRLSPAKLPHVLVAVKELPRTSTLKLKRVGFAESVGLPVLDGPPRCFWYDSAQQEGNQLQTPRVDTLRVERVLEMHIGVAQACMVDLSGEVESVMVITPSQNTRELMDMLYKVIPDFYLPKHLVALDALPAGADDLRADVLRALKEQQLTLLLESDPMLQLVLEELGGIIQPGGAVVRLCLVLESTPSPPSRSLGGCRLASTSPSVQCSSSTPPARVHPPSALRVSKSPRRRRWVGWRATPQ